jgi:hypothetical protein
MNVHEGARRMRHAGIWLSQVSFLLGALLLGFQTVLLLRFSTGPFIAGFAILGVFLNVFPCAFLFGVLLWIAGWIVEGFAMEKSEP